MGSDSTRGQACSPLEWRLGASAPRERLSVEKSASAGPGPGAASAAFFRWLLTNHGEGGRDLERRVVRAFHHCDRVEYGEEGEF